MTDGFGSPAALRVFFYVQHLLGIGHLVRASRIAEAMVSAGMEVTLVTGGSRIEGFPKPGVRHVQLPTVLASSSSFSGLAQEDGTPVDATFEAQRTARLLQVFHDQQPDVVLIEAFPFGRRQMRFELLPLLDAISKASPRPLLLSSVRDILQENRKPGRDQETVDHIKVHFDGILVHGDPSFVRLEETFPLAADIADKVFYTGLVAPGEPEPSTDHFDVVVSAGGGAVGGALINAALDAQQLLGDQRRWCVITGPNLPQLEFETLGARVPPNVSLFRFRPDFPNLLPKAEVSISQAGYNTVCDLLRARCASILIPFASGGETEQTVRAQKLEEMGLAIVVEEADLSGEAVADALQRAAMLRSPPTMNMHLDGAHQTSRIIGDMTASSAKTDN
ncbi:glycosyltransferase family protein [Rhizobium oryzicola]|uniref:Glycosyltransferase n=1 Tax=Rhizobium oryzicola TaxID=1232668 RepID=A0ABT8SWV2_9HYPH|nr:glycosyltransferase [Rhizobium oryzicola]MDO1582913.1 glycosyltransferase [Rhizobium oryzicola]